MVTSSTDFDLTTDMIQKFLDLGIRPVKTREPNIGDMVASFMLIPTKRYQFRDSYKGNWEGSYIPMIVYTSGSAAILVPAGEEAYWLRLANHISAITKLHCLPRPD